jgi:glycosyltransferase involved in cell wall biosynthesis
MKLLVAIPALNEENSIVSVIGQVKSALSQATILVIDDGSTDSTAKLAKIAGAKVISIPFNVGVGGALRVAFRYAVENGFTEVLQVDADGQHLPKEAILLIASSKKDSIVIGSRFRSGTKNYPVGISRKIAMTVLAKIISIICRTKLTDVTSGFRLTTGAAISLFAKEYPRDYLGDTVESLIIAHKSSIAIYEVPVEMKKREQGSPSQNIFKSIWYLIRALLVILLSSVKKTRKS